MKNRSMMFTVGILAIFGVFVLISILRDDGSNEGGTPTSQPASESPDTAGKPGPSPSSSNPDASKGPGVTDRDSNEGTNRKLSIPGADGNQKARAEARAKEQDKEGARLEAPPLAAPAWKASLDLCLKRIEAGEVGPALRELGYKYRQIENPDARTYWRGPLLQWAGKYLITPSKKSGMYSLHVVKPGDSLVRVAKKLKKEKKIFVDPSFLQEVNGIRDPRRMQEGDRIWVPDVNPQVEVRLKEYRLDHFLGDCLLASYSVGVGRDGKTPQVEFVVKSKLEKPDWTYEGQIIPYGDEKNELGERWIGFHHDSWRGFGIHGTNDEASVGSGVSRGCIRMKNKDVIQVFNRIPKGMVVKIRP